MAEILATLRELAHICRDGERLYGQAAARMRSPHLRELAGEVGRVRGELHLEFAALLQERGARSSDAGTLYGAVHKLYAEARARLSSDRDRVYVCELESAEDRLLHAMERATLRFGDDARALLGRHMPAARAAHERIRSLKHELTKAAV